MPEPIALCLGLAALVLLGLGAAHALRGTRATQVGAIAALALAPVLGIAGTVAMLVASFGATAQVRSAEKAHVLAGGISSAMHPSLWGVFAALPLGVLLVLGEQRRARARAHPGGPPAARSHPEGRPARS